MLRKISLSIALFFMLLPLQSAAQLNPDYIFLLSTEEGDLYIDQKNIISYGDVRDDSRGFDVYTILMLKEEREGVASIETISKVNCDNRTIRSNRIKNLDSQGHVILDRINNLNGVRFSTIAISEGSTDEAIYENVCRSELLDLHFLGIVKSPNDQWQYLGSDADNDMFLDMSRIINLQYEHEYEYAEVWLIVVPKQENSEYSRFEILMGLACSGPLRGTYSQQYIVAHHRVNGSVIRQDLDGTKETIAPGTPSDNMWRKVCE